MVQPFFEINREKSKSMYIDRSVNNNTEPHFHSNIEMVYVLEGEINITINGHTKCLKKDEASIALSYDIHSYNTEQSSEIYVVIIPLDYISSFVSISKGKSPSSYFLDKNKNSAEILHCFKMLYKDKDSNNILKTKGYIYVILSLIVEILGFENKKNTEIFPREVLIYIQENYLKKITLTSISEKFGYNKYYFSKFFNTYFGYSLNEYINSLRSRHAATLLLESDQSIIEAALNSGFDNQRTFNRAFQKTFGVSPSEYIKSEKLIDTVT